TVTIAARLLQSAGLIYAKANPGKIDVASAGPGSTPHLYAELFKMMAGVDHPPCVVGFGSHRPAFCLAASPNLHDMPLAAGVCWIGDSARPIFELEYWRSLELKRAVRFPGLTGEGSCRSTSSISVSAIAPCRTTKASNCRTAPPPAKRRWQSSET